MTSLRFAPSKIRWYPIESHGYPPRELRTTEHNQERVFMVMTDEGLKASAMFPDGSGFSDIGDGSPISWAFE